MKSYDERYGARPIKRYVSRNLETLLAEAIIKDEIPSHSTVTVQVKNHKLVLNK